MSGPPEIPNGLHLREAVKLAQQLGLRVRIARGTGDYIFSWPGGSMRHNCRRKDCSRALVNLLRRVSRGESPR